MSIITVYLHTIYQIQTPDGPKNKLLIPADQVKIVADILKIIGGSFHMESTLLVLNGKIVSLSDPVKPGDEFHLIPAISGGCGLD